MTKRQIKKYILHWQRLLRLEEWDIRVKTVEADHIAEDLDGTGLNRIASINSDQADMRADIVLATELPDDEITEAIRHELLHLALTNLVAFSKRVISQLGTEAKAICAAEGGMLEERTVICLERMVDCLLIEQKDKSDAG